MKSGQAASRGGAEEYYCDVYAAFDDPNENASTNDEVHWAVWSFDARVNGFGLYMSRPDSTVGKDGLEPNQWADIREFSNTQPSWTRQSWNYAQPFDLGPNGPAFDNLTKGAYANSGTFQNSGNWSVDAWTYACNAIGCCRCLLRRYALRRRLRIGFGNNCRRRTQ